MFESIPSHGTPQDTAYGVLGEIFQSDTGVAYIKDGSDTLNVGWIVLNVTGSL